ENAQAIANHWFAPPIILTATRRKDTFPKRIISERIWFGFLHATAGRNGSGRGPPARCSPRRVSLARDGHRIVGSFIARRRRLNGRVEPSHRRSGGAPAGSALR